MTYQVLARKWRPRDFSQMVGQGHVLRALVNALDSQRLHHAYLFTGTRGVGKTSIARVLAKALNCEQGVSSTPCGKCSACVEVDEGRFVDLIEVDAASRTKVDETRELLENVQYAPARGRFKVYLIDEVHMFSNHSFNALLKTLEEPPPHVKFLLATTDPKRLPITILSRCLQFNLKRLGAGQIHEQLERILAAEGIDAESGALALIAAAADGSMRDSLSLLDQAIAFTGGRLEVREVATMLGTVGTEQVIPLVTALAAGDARALIGKAREIAEFAPDFAQVLGEMLSLLRRIAVVQTLGAEAADVEENNEVHALAGSLSPEDCQLFYQLGLLGRRDLPLAPEPQVGFEMALLRMLAFRPEETVSTTPAPAAAPPRSAAASGAPRAPVRDTAAGIERARPDVARAAPAASPTQAPAGPVAGTSNVLDWAVTVEQLETTGLVRELARHCALQSYDGRVVELALTPQSESLRTERQVRALEQALRQALQREVIVRFVSGPRDGATPARLRTEAEAARQAAAQRHIEEDPNVQTLQRQFGATIEQVAAKEP
ncbi:MAG: DNA polymerase III subunit gamma/tau [Gammaproteobacteria bacterium]